MAEQADFLELLSPQQRRFVYAYVLQGESVVVRAIAAADEIGAKRPEAFARRMLRRESIQEAIKQVQRDADMPEEEIRASVAELGRISMDDFLKLEEGEAHFDLEQARERAALKAVKHLELNAAGRVVKLTLHDPLAALKLAARINGMLVERQEVSGPEGGPIQTEANVHVYLPSNGRDED